MDTSDCFFEDTLAKLKPSRFYLFFIDSRSSFASAMPILLEDVETALNLIRRSCIINPPTYPAVGIDRWNNVLQPNLINWCPTNAISQSICLVDLKISEIFSVANMNFLQQNQSQDPEESSDYKVFIFVTGGVILTVFVVVTIFMIKKHKPRIVRRRRQRRLVIEDEESKPISTHRKLYTIDE